MFQIENNSSSDQLFHYFGQIVHESVSETHSNLCKYLKANEATVKSIGKEYYCDPISMPDVKGDEFTVLLLSIVYDLKVCVILNGEIWFTKKNSTFDDCALYLGHIESNGFVCYLTEGHSSKEYSQLISKLKVLQNQEK